MKQNLIHVITFISPSVGRALARQKSNLHTINVHLKNSLVKSIAYTLFTLFLSFSSVSYAFTEKPLRIAVASNFTPLLKVLLIDFEKQTKIKTQLISGSTGTLYLQIKHGAPFDIFIAADVKRPKELEQEDLIIEHSRKTYTVGQLALFSQNKVITLADLSIPPKHFAIANPDTAPYGKAAKETLQHLGLWSLYKNKLITGINVNQTFAQLRSQAVSSGLVAYSQLVLHQLDGIKIPSTFHQPLKQQLVIVKTSENISKAKLLSQFLLSSEIQQQIINGGYLSLAKTNKAQDDKS